MATNRIVIAGAGLAGAKTAEALRGQGFDGRITLVGNERHRPYNRPPLSKEYLAGKSDRDSVFVHQDGWYPDNDVDLRLGVEVTEIDRAARRVVLAGADDLSYDRLLLATGAAPRRLPVPGADATGVHYLRRLEDSETLQRVIAQARRLVVIGAGWIGLEVAATARTAGLEVTVVEAARLPLLRVLGPEVAAIFAQLHRDHGVDLRFQEQITEITQAGGRATGVRLGDGSHLAADAVLVAVGVEPNVRLAAEAGLDVHNGIVVDDALHTNDPHILAAGDVANAFHPLLGRHVRVEHWANALNQPAAAAAAMLTGTASYHELPYFYTDQYDLGMEYTGYVEPGDYDRVVFRGNTEAREFVAFWVRGSRVLAGMNVNVWDVVDPINAMIRSGGQVDLDQLADPDCPLDEVSVD
ncbi:NAD(P)/FAD-dependent oxidoreductase [Actinophytocola sp.]|uniref:NAD(P)/FAD-dependent oxidoreductase n=1 Tax=Actinophytocola sp. TaxID=1872138 RepID=UPI002D7F9DBB|nr:FAD-dependent oxidoreductase [Actinophytocola sp.]HET9143282.1 FAD-dependent oxidoreductase [Actinophytocola sp.]